MKDSDINWEKVAVLEVQDYDDVSLEMKDVKGIKNFKLSFKVLIYENNDKRFYRLFAFLPFSFKSSWITTEQSDWKEYALERLKGVLLSKYNEIKIRDYNHRNKFNQFKKIISKQQNEEQLFGWYSSDLNHKHSYEKIGDKTIGEIWNELNSITKISTIKELEGIKDYKPELHLKKFVTMLVNDRCGYCGLSVEDILLLAKKSQLFTKRARGYTLEIDQKEAYKFYSDENCIASCYWCNNAKTDEFTEGEFITISSHIKSSWNNRLGIENEVLSPK